MRARRERAPILFPRRPSLKQFWFGVVLIGMGIAMLEGVSWWLLRATPDLGDRSQLAAQGLEAGARARAASRIGQQFADGRFLEEVVHPFLGYAVAPSDAVLDGPLSLESLGFPGGGPLVRERRADTVVMGIFGGSVAYYFAHSHGPQRIFDGLQALPGFSGKQLVVLSGANIGYKQPQSLMALAYLQALGVKMDLVILLDGFNEVVVSRADDLASGVFPFFPGHWRDRVARLDTATAMRSLIGEIAYRNEQRSSWSTWFTNSRLAASNTATLLWALFDRHLERTVEARRQALKSPESSRELEYTASGPRWRVLGVPALVSELADFWMESSFAMRALAEQNGARFFHFLQPNQHVPGSKPMTPEEVAVAIDGGESFAPFVEAGYPALRARGQRLVERGVQFHDLTLVFADTHEPVYVDNIGHVGGLGNEMIADAIAAALRVDLAPAAQ